MGISLSVTDGTTTVDLADGTNAYPTEYTPREPADATALFVEDTPQMFFGTTTGGRNKLLLLKQLFDQARRFFISGKGPRVYLQYRPDTAEVLHRAQLFDGYAPPDDNLHKAAWGGNYLESPMRLRRGPFEGAEVGIPLTNANGSNNLSGLTVYNHDDSDSGHDNYVAMAAGFVDGALPTPLKIEVTNTYNSSARLSNLYIGHNVFSTPGTFAHVLEGEDSTAGGVVTASGSNSSGAYMARSWTGSGDTIAYRWTLSSSTLNAAKGNFFRVIARLAGGPIGTVWVRVRVQQAGLSDVYTGQWVKLTPYVMQSIDSLQLPPWLTEVTSIGSLDLVLEARRDNAGTNSLNVDYVHLFPLDGWREYRARGYGVQYNEKLVDDAILDRLYVLTTGAEAYGHYVGSGEIMLVPNRDQRLYFLQQDWLGNAAIDRSLSVKVWHRPRRWTIEA